MLMETMKLPGVVAYDQHTAMHTSTVNTDISLAIEFQKYLPDPTWEHGLLYQVKDRKRASKWKRTECEYHVQDSKHVPH